MLNLTPPKHVMPKYTEAVGGLCAAFANDPDLRPLISILVGGSVARGTATEDSDVDVFVTFGGNWCQRRRQVIADVPFDIFIDPATQAEHFISSGLNDVMIENYADGWIVLDPTGFAQRMKNVSQSLLARPRRAPSEGEIYMLCERAEDRFKALLTCQSDPTIFKYVSAAFVVEAVEAFYVLSRSWRPRLNSVPSDLRKREPRFYEDLSLLYSEEINSDDKVSAARGLTDRILRAGRSLGYKPGQGPKTFIKPGPGVTLRIGEQTITVRK